MTTNCLDCYFKVAGIKVRIITLEEHCLRNREEEKKFKPVKMISSLYCAVSASQYFQVSLRLEILLNVAGCTQSKNIFYTKEADLTQWLFNRVSDALGLSQ